MPELQQTLGALIQAQPLLGPLAADPSLRGLMQTLTLLAKGGSEDGAQAQSTERAFEVLADTVEAAIAGRTAPLAWASLISGRAPDPRELRRFVLISPVLDYGALEPGARATNAVRAAATALNIRPENGVRLRLTGQVPLADEEFATLRQGAGMGLAITLSLVGLLLWLALRSGRIIAAIAISLFMGLAITAALGLMMVGAFNPISIAFAVLFVGLGVDFGIQMGVSYRAQRYEHNDLNTALHQAGAQVGSPLALAAYATALGFLAFLPTVYRGVAELGLIAGSGMVIAFASSITVLPALLRVLKPAMEAAPVGLPLLAPLDVFLHANSRAIIIGAAIVTIASAATLPLLRFDFNLLNLRSTQVESMATLLDLAKNPQTTPLTIEVLEPDMRAAQALATRAASLPQVAQALTLSSFVPNEQDAKLALIADAALLLGPVLYASTPPPTNDTLTVNAMNEAAHVLKMYRGHPPDAKQAHRLAGALTTVAANDAATRDRAHEALIPGLKATLSQLRAALSPQKVTLESLPLDLVRDWTSVNGRVRVEIFPAGDSTDNAVLERFVTAITQIAPHATGAPVTMKASARAIVRAFIEAGAWALLAITALLIVVLRRASEVAITLAPLVLSGLLTMALCVIIELPLNYANIIALPLLFGIGVAFNIYFVMAWRKTQVLLASSLSRAVIFSAATTASAFGSLWLSSHPGTASMGQLLALSLACTLGCALIFLPALLALSARHRD